jgi:hypothetical protein
MTGILIDNPDIVSIERYGQTYEKRDINLLRVKCFSFYFTLTRYEEKRLENETFS